MLTHHSTEIADLELTIQPLFPPDFLRDDFIEQREGNEL